MNNISVVISAPSGAGKTTVIKQLLTVDNRFEFSVSTTTRPKREKEVNGKSYNFVQIPEFREMIDGDEFIEWAEVHGNYYGITKKEIDRIHGIGKIPIFDVDVKGAKTLKKTIDNAVFIFIVPPSRKALEERLRKRRTDSENQIKIRLNNAIEELNEFELYEYVLINSELDVAVNDLRSIITAELCRKKRNLFIIKKIKEA